MGRVSVSEVFGGGLPSLLLFHCRIINHETLITESLEKPVPLPMSLSRLLSDLFAGSEPSTESPATAQGRDESEEPTVVLECRNCGTNVSPDTDRCPACDGDDIVRYSID